MLIVIKENSVSGKKGLGLGLGSTFVKDIMRNILNDLPPCVKRRAINRSDTPIHGIPPTSGDLRYTPEESAGEGGG